MAALAETRTRYIRCIKPNTRKRPLLMEHVSTVEQLRCAGVVAAVTISRSAFPNRLDHEVVLDRFKSLWPKGGDHLLRQFLEKKDAEEEDTATEMDRTRKSVELLLSLALKELEFERDGVIIRAFVIGKSRAYFRAGALEFLEGERLKFLSQWATEIQRTARGFVRRSQYVRVRSMAICLQSCQRRHVATRAYKQLKQATVKVQCWYRVLYAVQTLYQMRRNYRSTQIQTRWRILVARRRLRMWVSATVIAQTMVRGALQRPKFRQALHEKKEEAKLENQLRSLQRKLEEAEHKRVQAEKEAEERAARALRELQEKEEAEKRRQEEEAKRKEEEAAAAAAQAALEESQKFEEEQARAAAEAAAREEEERLRKEQEQIAEKEGLKRQLEEQKREQEEIQQQLTAEQQLLMDESGRMLEYLRKEVFKLRGQNTQLKTDFDLLKDNNQRLMDANASAGASFAALNNHTKQLSKQNAKLQEDVGTYRGQVQKLNVLQVELKEELKMKQATYIAEVHSRIQYQKALGKITDLIQESCRDHRLVERVLQVVDECEMEYQSGVGPDTAPPPPENGTAAGKEAKSGSILGSILPSIFG